MLRSADGSQDDQTSPDRHEDNPLGVRCHFLSNFHEHTPLCCVSNSGVRMKFRTAAARWATAATQTHRRRSRIAFPPPVMHWGCSLCSRPWRGISSHLNINSVWLVPTLHSMDESEPTLRQRFVRNAFQFQREASLRSCSASWARARACSVSRGDSVGAGERPAIRLPAGDAYDRAPSLPCCFPCVSLGA